MTAKPDTSNPAPEAAYSNFIPGLALKFLRTGTFSANMVAINSFDGQPSWNFFKYDLSNHVTGGATP